MHGLRLRLLTAATTCLVSAWAVAAAPEPEVPVANPAAATQAVWDAVTAVSKAPHGTVYANVRIGADGRATVGDLFGTLQKNEPALTIVRQAMPAFVFEVPEGWDAPQPWVVFWIFQNRGCRDREFDAPRSVTVVRVCIDIGGAVRLQDAPSVRFETTRPYALAQSLPKPNFLCDYPKEARRRRDMGTAAVLLRVDATGAGQPIRLIESTRNAVLDDATLECVKGLRFRPPDGTLQGDDRVMLRWTWRIEP